MLEDVEVVIEGDDELAVEEVEDDVVEVFEVVDDSAASGTAETVELPLLATNTSPLPESQASVWVAPGTVMVAMLSCATATRTTKAEAKNRRTRRIRGRFLMDGLVIRSRHALYHFADVLDFRPLDCCT